MARQKRFFLCLDQYKPIEDLTLEQKGCILDAMFAYHSGVEPEIADPEARLAFRFFKQWFESDKPKIPGSADCADDSKAPPCPHQQILSLYHELLPELPRMKVWDGARQQNLTARWRERWKAGHYATQADGLAYWRRMFEYIGRKCDWLMGRSENYGGRKPFQASLDWIVRPQNFAKIIERKYENQEAA